MDVPADGLRLGVHLGNARAQVALVDSGELRASAATEAPLGAGVGEALNAALSALPLPSDLTAVTIALSWLSIGNLSASDLTPVAVLRLAHAEHTVAPPLYDWPAPLHDAVHGWSCVQPGGSDLTRRQFGELDVGAVLDFVGLAVGEGARSLAVSAVGAPMLAEQETAVAEAVRRQFPDLNVTLSNEVGGLGLLARENTAVLNAALHAAAEAVAEACDRVTHEVLPGIPVLFSRHDAALMNSEYLRRFPVAAADADIAATLRGAGLLADVSDAIVLEWDGTVGRIGLLESGRPHRRSQAGKPPLSLLTPNVTSVDADSFDAVLHRLLASRTRPILATAAVPDGLAEVSTLACGRFAGAFGAATAQPAAEVDRVLVEPAAGELTGIVDRVTEEALVRAISAGARPESVTVTDVYSGPVAYLPSNVVRVHVRAAGTV